jgi:hypothetical protein
MFEISNRIATLLRRVDVQRSFDRFRIFGSDRAAYFLRARTPGLAEATATHALGEDHRRREHLVNNRFAA